MRSGNGNDSSQSNRTEGEKTIAILPDLGSSAQGGDQESIQKWRLFMPLYTLI